MHKIERLLQTLAPKGVEFRKLGEMTISFTKQTGFDYSAFIKPTLIKEYLPNYIPFIQNKDFLGHYINYKTDYFIPNEIAIRFPQILLNEKCLLISISGSIGKVAVFNHSQDAFIGGAIAVLKFKEKKSLDFVMHFLMSASGQKLLLNGVKSGSHKNLTIADLKKITIPIPPLEIQQEIVKILDAFTELNTELNTELKARKKQYEYYQNMLLDFKDINSNHKGAKMSAKTYPKRLQTLLQTLAPKGVEFKTLEEVFEIKNGYTPSKNNLEFWEKGTIPWFRMEDIRENGRILKDSIQHITPKALKGKKLFPKNSIIISTTATIGEHALLIVDSLANQQFTFLSKKANCGIALDMKFFFYQCFLLGEWCKKNTNVSGFASVDMTAFKKYKFPIPPLEIQQEIVKILDQFLALTTDLLAGIPAEIEARKKQYEYYREKLLTFKPLKA
ncbi:restriction endonuclease subunit S [Helicobacter pylori]|nr:restriction endonuclease subunit S [Helicobacter pylori]